jgi:hypothetical protein
VKTEVIPEVMEGYKNRLKNKLYSLLCAREEGAEWEMFLDSILLELEGVPVEDRGINFLVLYYKTSSLRHADYKWFRKTIFDCMSLLSGGDKDANELL